MNQLKDIDDGTLRRVDWQEVVPGTLMFRSFAQTFKPFFLVVYTAVVTLCSTLGLMARCVRRPKMEAATDLLLCNLQEDLPSRSDLLHGLLGFLAPYTFHAQASPLARLITALVAVLALTFFSLAFARIVAALLASSAHVSLRAALGFAFKRFPSALLVLVLESALLGALWFGAWLVSRVAFLAPIAFMILGFFCFFALLFLAAYPLALAAIATENTDGFDAISRSLAYVSQRFLFWIVYSVIAMALVLLGCLIVELFVLCWSWAFNYVLPEGAFSEYLLNEFCLWFVAFLPTAYFAAAWIAHNCAIYVILRRSVDGSPFDKCAVNLNTKQRRLRQILTDMQGAPQINPQFTAQEQANAGEDATAAGASTETN